MVHIIKLFFFLPAQLIPEVFSFYLFVYFFCLFFLCVGMLYILTIPLVLKYLPVV